MRRRRWRCAAPSRWPTTTTRTARAAQRPGHRGAIDHPALHLGLRGGYRSDDERARPGARHGACSISTATSTAMATAGASCPTARRWCCACRPPAARSRGAPTSCGASTWRAWACASSSTSPPGRICLKRSRNATLMMGLRLGRSRQRRRLLPRHRLRAELGRPNDARFAPPAFDRLFERQSVRPTAPSASR